MKKIISLLTVISALSVTVFASSDVSTTNDFSDSITKSIIYACVGIAIAVIILFIPEKKINIVNFIKKLKEKKRSK